MSSVREALSADAETDWKKVLGDLAGDLRVVLVAREDGAIVAARSSRSKHARTAVTGPKFRR